MPSKWQRVLKLKRKNLPQTLIVSQMRVKTMKPTSQYTSVGDRLVFDFGPLKSGSYWYFSPTIFTRRCKNINFYSPSQFCFRFCKKLHFVSYLIYRIHCLLQTNYNLHHPDNPCCCFFFFTILWTIRTILDVFLRTNWTELNDLRSTKNRTHPKQCVWQMLCEYFSLDMNAFVR